MARSIPIGDSREFQRRHLLTQILKSGWPPTSDYCDVPYSDKTRAEEIHTIFLMNLTEMALDDDEISARVIKLGPCARTNMPRAMYLIGMVESDEGGADVVLPRRWPVLNSAKEYRDDER